MIRSRTKRQKARAPSAAWAKLLEASKRVLANWESGDLAMAVNELRRAIDTLESKAVHA
jgi:hypothetical protein